MTEKLKFSLSYSEKPTMRRLSAFIIGTLLLLTSCGMEGSNSGRTRNTSVNNLAGGSCNCTFNYDPVCGADGKTYDNACMAGCFNVQYTNGGTCADLLICNINSGTVCGQPPMPVCPEGMACVQVLPPARYYNNECERSQAGAQAVPMSACQTSL